MKADSSGGDPHSDIQHLVPGGSTKVGDSQKVAKYNATIREEKLATRKTTRKSVMKTNTSSGSRCTTVGVNKILENYKLY